MLNVNNFKYWMKIRMSILNKKLYNAAYKLTIIKKKKLKA